MRLVEAIRDAREIRTVGDLARRLTGSACLVAVGVILFGVLG